MIVWRQAERRWLGALLSAMAPPGQSGLPGIGAIDPGDFWAEFQQSAPATLRVGLRLAVWFLTWLPLFIIGVPKPFYALPPEAQQRLFEKAGYSRWYPIRQLTLLIKLVACFFYFKQPSVRCRIEAMSA